MFSIINDSKIIINNKLLLIVMQYNLIISYDIIKKQVKMTKKSAEIKNFRTT